MCAKHPACFRAMCAVQSYQYYIMYEILSNLLATSREHFTIARDGIFSISAHPHSSTLVYCKLTFYIGWFMEKTFSTVCVQCALCIFVVAPKRVPFFSFYVVNKIAHPLVLNVFFFLAFARFLLFTKLYSNSLLYNSTQSLCTILIYLLRS